MRKSQWTLMIKNANEFIPDFYTVNCDSIWLQAK